MKCPYCNEADTKVIDSRPADDNSSIRRRRQCERCGKRFTTYEKLETMPLMVIKKDDSREAYDRSKIEAGILHSCRKCRPVSPRQISTMIDEIENQIFNREEKEIPTSVIGELVMDKLKSVDEVAYVRFASVYREFEDVSTFYGRIGKTFKEISLKKVEFNMFQCFYPSKMEGPLMLFMYETGKNGIRGSFTILIILWSHMGHRRMRKPSGFLSI